MGGDRLGPTMALTPEEERELREQLAPKQSVKNLSMGMSNDFEVAVEEGATFVRLGSVLLEGLSS